MQAIVDNDDTFNQKQMAKILNVEQTISDRLKAMGKMQECGKWLPHGLNDRQMVKQKSTCETLLLRYERMSVLHRIVTMDYQF